MKLFRLSGEIDLKVKVKIQLKLMIPPTPLPSGAWGKSYLWTLLKWDWRAWGESDHWSPEEV